MRCCRRLLCTSGLVAALLAPSLAAAAGAAPPRRRAAEAAEAPPGGAPIPAPPQPPGDGRTYEAEAGAVGGPEVRVVHGPNASQQAAVGPLGERGAYVEVTGVDGGSGGQYVATVRYAARLPQQALRLVVNGAPTARLDFAATGGTGSYCGDVAVAVALRPGPSNTLRLENEGGCGGEVYIDFVRVTPDPY